MKISVIINSNGERTDRMEYPLEALREAVANALIHRDYSIHTENEPIRLTIFDDRIETDIIGMINSLNIEDVHNKTINEMINREDFNGKRYEEMAEAMQADLVLYKEHVASFNDLDTCINEEQILMGSMDEVQERLDTVEYDLAESIEYDGKKYSKKDVVAKLVYFINKLEVKWEQTLGLYQLLTMWKRDDFKKVPYRVYDSTLRCLNQVTFKGLSEWTDILVLNEYLSKCHNEYSLDTGMLVYLSECHNVLMNRMKELNPDADVPESLED